MSVVTATLNPCVDKSCVVARVVPNRKLSAHGVRHDPGGGGLNVARVIVRLDGQVRALWTCGGSTGERLAAMLEAEGVAHQPVRIADEIRENLIVEDRSSKEQYRFGMPGPALSEAERGEWLTQLRELSPAPAYLVVSGSLPPGVPIDGFAELLAAIPREVRIVVDSKREALARAVDLGVYLIKPNASELAELFGEELDDEFDVEAAGREIVEGGGAEVVLVSLGRGGALLISAEGTQRFSAPEVPLRSKVGAGDSLVGGLVAGLDRGEALADAVARGVAAGAAAVMTPGTELCRREDVERLYPRVGRRPS
ncbi:MAG: 1-phosphofructokinase family hexose kinase [Enhygromyxa sp.]